MMSPRPHDQPRTWRRAFANAFRGCWIAVRAERSFHVHVVCAAVVLAAAAAVGVQLWQWCLLVLAIALVGVAEMLNTALERLAKAVDVEENPHLRDALDIGSAAVVLAAGAAVVIGGIVFLGALFAA